jgi:hypothetical protein
MAGCKPADEEGEDTNGDGTTPGGTTPGGTTPPATVDPGTLAGRYFKTLAYANGNDDVNRQFEITSEGHLVSYSGTTSVARDFYITSVADGKLSLTYVPKYGTGTETGTVAYVYTEADKTLTVSNFASTMSEGFYLGRFDISSEENEIIFFQH